MWKAKHIVAILGFLFATACFVVIGLVLVAVQRTLTLQEIDVSLDVENVPEYVMTEAELSRYVATMGGALRFATVSTAPGHFDRDQLLGLNQFLANSFPAVFNSSFVRVETVNTYSLLLTVQGNSGSLEALSPFLLSGHLDVVPADPAEWSHAPFLGEAVPDPETGEAALWGRGAVDNKAGVVGILSALDFLLTRGWTPQRTFFVAFGHDEEVFGEEGAGHISKLLQDRNVSLDFLLDEGMPIVQGIIQGLEAPVAVIGVTEKGRMDVEIRAEGDGGHSSFPPQQQAVRKLALALTRLYDHPQPSMFGSGPEEDMLNYLAPKASWPQKLVFANTWLFRPLLSHVLSRKRETDAIHRTTTAVTIVKAGVKINVVPASAIALVNHRVHPGQSLRDVLAHDIAAIGDDQIKVELLNGDEPHPVSPYGSDSLPYKLIAGAVKHVYPDAVTAPGLLIGNTDTKFYLPLTSHVYRFTPVLLTSATTSCIHGKDERLTVSNLKAAILFYSRLIQTSEHVGAYQTKTSTKYTVEL